MHDYTVHWFVKSSTTSDMTKLTYSHESIPRYGMEQKQLDSGMHLPQLTRKHTSQLLVQVNWMFPPVLKEAD